MCPPMFAVWPHPRVWGACRCNGLSYTMNYVDEAPKLDDVVDAGESESLACSVQLQCIVERVPKYSVHAFRFPMRLYSRTLLSPDVKVFVDPKAVMYLVGSVMDFVEDAVRAEFVFQNPNAKGACGCGESFNV